MCKSLQDKRETFVKRFGMEAKRGVFAVVTIWIGLASVFALPVGAQAALGITVGRSPKPFSVADPISAGMSLTGKRWGFRIAMAGYSEAPSDLIDYSIPHGDYTAQGSQSTTPIFGADLLFTTNPARWWSVYAGGGAFLRESVEVVRSNVTGWSYRSGDPSMEYWGDAIGGLSLKVLSLPGDGGKRVPMHLGAEYSLVTGPAAVFRFVF